MLHEWEMRYRISFDLRATSVNTLASIQAHFTLDKRRADIEWARYLFREFHGNQYTAQHRTRTKQIVIKIRNVIKGIQFQDIGEFLHRVRI